MTSVKDLPAYKYYKKHGRLQWYRHVLLNQFVKGGHQELANRIEWMRYVIELDKELKQCQT